MRPCFFTIAASVFFAASQRLHAAGAARLAPTQHPSLPLRAAPRALLELVELVREVAVASGDGSAALQQ